MSPFYLIEVSDLYRRAGITRHSHVRLMPARLTSVLRNLFVARRRACSCR
ncbi:hypothetical protein P3T23_004809 [Paraburkholderia sp. GAS448]